MTTTSKSLPIKKVILLYVLVCLATLVCGWLGYTWHLSGKLKKELEAIREASEPTRLADFAAPKPAANENAYDVLLAVEPELQKLEQQLMPLYDQREAGWNNEQLAAIASAFEAAPQAMPAVLQAAGCRTYASPVVPGQTAAQFSTDRINSSSKLRVVARVLLVHQIWLQQQGRADEAVADGILMLKLADLAEHEPTLVAYLVSIAVRGMALQGTADVLQHSNVQAATRQQLDHQLASYDATRRFQGALISERPFGLATLDEQGRMLPFQHARSLAYLKYIQDEIANAAAPMPGAPPIPVAPTGWTGALFGQMAIATLTPAIQAARGATERSRAMTNAVRVLNAIQGTTGFRADVPEDLERLGLPREALLDPWTGQPLRVKQVGEQWSVYSAGLNRRDDGGPDAENSDDLGIGQ